MCEGFPARLEAGVQPSVSQDLAQEPLHLHNQISGRRIGVENGFAKSVKQRTEDKPSKNKPDSIAPGLVGERSSQKGNALDELQKDFPIDRDADGCRDAAAAARAWGYLFCFWRGDELRSSNCAFSFETSSRSAANSFCTPADPGSPFDSLAGDGADGTKPERGIHGARKLAADDVAAGRTEVK
jgi:hypothetical protein